MCEMVLVFKALLPDHVALCVMLSAQRKGGHALVDYLLAVAAHTNVVAVMQVCVPSADAAFFGYKTAVDVIADVIDKV